MVVHPDYDTWKADSCHDPAFNSDAALPQAAFVGEKEPELTQLMLDQG